MTQFDAYGAAVLRTAVDAHLNVNPQHRVSIIEPRASDVWPLVSDALGRLPTRAAWAGTRSPATRGLDVLLPAVALRPTEATLYVDTVKMIAAALHHGARPGQLLQEAARHFLDNVEEHAANSPIPPVLCAAFDPVARNLQLVCVNLSAPDARLALNEHELRQMVDDQDRIFRSLATLATRPRGDLDFTVRLVTGAGHARHRTTEDWKLTQTATTVPGFVAGLEIHR